MSGCRCVAGRLFHSFGPATEKLLSPRRVLVRGTVRALALAEQRRQHTSLPYIWSIVDQIGVSLFLQIGTGSIVPVISVDTGSLLST